jgi:recombination protein RecA
MGVSLVHDGTPILTTNYIMDKEKKKEREEKPNMAGRDELADALAEALNKDNKVAFFLDADDDNPSQIIDWVSTGNDLLDVGIANRPHAGVPVGRITELTGLESSGKSLLAAHILAETQKKGGMAVFIDTEYAASREFLKAIGVNLTKMLHIQNWDTVEDIFDGIEQIIAKVRNAKENKDRLLTIVVDSIAAASTKTEMAHDHSIAGYNTSKAILISAAMRKLKGLIATQRICLVFTNQLRAKVGFVGLGDPWTTGGGKALAFYSSLRVRLKAIGQIKNANKEVIGMKTKCTIIKNRMGPPMRAVEFNIFFDRGIDNYGNWLEKLMDWDIVVKQPAKKEKSDKPEKPEKKKTKKEIADEKEEDKKKAKFLQFVMTVEGKEPETVVFEKKDLPKLLQDRPDCKEYLYNKVCEEYIMKYKAPNTEMADDIEISEEGEGMDD